MEKERVTSPQYSCSWSYSH